jgi:hypothetical protein
MKKRRLPVDIEFLIESILSESPDLVVASPKEKLIKEDPDDVYTIEDSGLEYVLANFDDDDAVAFMTFPTYSIICPGGVHAYIKSFLSKIYINLFSGRKVTKQDVEAELKKGFTNIKVSNIDSMIKDLDGGVTGKAFEAGVFATATKYRYGIKNALSGRFWSDKNVISFWNKKEDTLNNWDQIRQLFKDHNQYGSVDQYEIDFLERKFNSSIPLTPASDISRSLSGSKEPAKSTDASKQSNLIGKFLSNPTNLDKLTDSQMEKLAGKLHVMAPAQKNKVMKAAGMNHNKAAEIAVKLGMTVAEFNNIMQVAEEKIPTLSEIIEKIRNRK